MAKTKTAAKTAKTTRKSTASRSATKAKTATSPKSSRTAKTSKKTAKGAKAAKSAKPAKAGVAEDAVEAAEVVVDRRGTKNERRSDDRRTQTEPVASERRTLQRREKVTRRRQIDPTTCERDYTDDEIAFMAALDEYKRRNGRMFPTCSEILEVIRGLGYAKVSTIAGNIDPSENIAVAAGEVPSVHAPVALDADAPESQESLSF